MSTTNPLYADICALLDQLVQPKDTNIGNAPHQRFWWKNQNAPANQPPTYIDLADFLAITVGNWITVTPPDPGKLVMPGKPSQSYLYLALTGTKPFDGTQTNMMPDTSADTSGLARHATPQEQIMVETWINNNCPA
jgi:hypothetical protein